MGGNEYFVPGDGIDTAVITEEITSYLGEGAKVRHGVYHVSISCVIL